MKTYVTGGSGFVGAWLKRELESHGDEVTIADEDLDIRDPESCRRHITAAAPEVIYHLAAIADVAYSWREPLDTFTVNATGTLNVLQVARTLATPPRVLVVSSAEVYGIVKSEELPLTEDHPVRPVSPYAMSKVAAEQVALQAHAGWGMPIVVARSFNHIGPGQSPNFVVPAIAQRIVMAQRDGVEEISVGNLSARRDFTDVRDVVRAYRLLVTDGEPGSIYNVCSGQDIMVGDIVEQLKTSARYNGKLVPDPDLMRPVEIPVVRGSRARIEAATGWHPEVPIEQTIIDVLEHWRKSGT